MTHEEILKLAREAGMEVHPGKGEIRIGSAMLTGCDSTEEVERFANLIEARAAAAEREACAKVCEELLQAVSTSDEHMYGVWDCVQAIRARSMK